MTHINDKSYLIPALQYITKRFPNKTKTEIGTALFKADLEHYLKDNNTITQTIYHKINNTIQPIYIDEAYSMINPNQNTNQIFTKYQKELLDNAFTLKRYETKQFQDILNLIKDKETFHMRIFTTEIGDAKQIPNAWVQERIKKIQEA